MGNWFKSGSPWIWMTGGAVSLSLISVLGLLLLISWRGLSFFWPTTVYEWQLQDSQGNSSSLIGQIYDQEQVPSERLIASGYEFATPPDEFITRYLIKTGNREIVGLDFRWVLATDIVSRSEPKDIAIFERAKNGNFYGYPQSVLVDGEALTTSNLALSLSEHVGRALELSEQALTLQKRDIGAINHELERLRLKQRKLQLDGELTDAAKLEIQAQIDVLNSDYLVLEQTLFDYRKQAQRDSVV
ncbi:MAG: phosphate ABC transporter permease PstA, partial [Shewanella sp.]